MAYSRSATRHQILQWGELLICTRGFNAFSYHDIAHPLGVKNATIHYHYPTKEALGVSVIRQAMERFEKSFALMDEKGLNEWQKLEHFIQLYARNHKEDKLCLVGALGAELHTLGPAVQEALQQLVECILKWLSQLLHEGRKNGQFAFRGSASTRALLVIGNLAAGLQLSRITPVADFNKVIRAIRSELKP